MKSSIVKQGTVGHPVKKYLYLSKLKTYDKISADSISFPFASIIM